MFPQAAGGDVSGQIGAAFQTVQNALFPPLLPPGFSYFPEVVSVEEEDALVRVVEALPFGEVRMHGVAAKRRVIQFGCSRYGGSRIQAAPEPPPLLADLRERCARFAGVEEGSLVQMMVTCYPPGAAIGWHRDSPMFGSPVAGLSLASACTMRLRPSAGEKSIPVTLEPRSLYLIDGEARSRWEHSIPPAKVTRYSVTMRTVLSASE
jgi:alkylated DNA repair protein (DNA oxidative demethylase)